ncbi:hypothetical protein TNCV_1734541 [Trichonephila clavipes]|nr:hypothetical protein TNCV_1734541 [Trichonephila clavipes]
MSITSRLTGAGSLLPPVYSEAWAKENAKVIPRTPFSSLRDAAHCKRAVPYRVKSLMLGMAKVVFSILLSGMMAIGRAMESGRSGYDASSGRKSLEVFGLVESLEDALWLVAESGATF